MRAHPIWVARRGLWIPAPQVDWPPLRRDLLVPVERDPEPVPEPRKPWSGRKCPRCGGVGVRADMRYCRPCTVVVENRYEKPAIHEQRGRKLLERCAP